MLKQIIEKDYHFAIQLTSSFGNSVRMVESRSW